MDDQPAQFFCLWLFADSKKNMTKGLQKMMTFVELTSQKKVCFTKNDSGMGILKKKRVKGKETSSK